MVQKKNKFKLSPKKSQGEAEVTCCLFQETGFWFVLHHVPTGLSTGMYPPGYSEHLPMGMFYNNRAHSNYRVSLHAMEMIFVSLLFLLFQFLNLKVIIGHNSCFHKINSEPFFNYKYVGLFPPPANFFFGIQVGFFLI